MGVRFRVNRARSLVTIILEDAMASSELVDAMTEIDRIPGITGFRRLVLASHRLALLEPTEIVSLADAVTALELTGTGRTAIVTFTDVHFGQARIYLTRRNLDEDRAQIFRDLKQALEWLGFSENAASIEFESAIALS